MKHKVNTGGRKLMDKLSKVDKYNYLGIELEQKLSPEQHVLKFEESQIHLRAVNQYRGEPLMPRGKRFGILS